MQGDSFPVERDPSGRTVQRIICTSCGAHDQNTITHNGRAGTDVLIAYFRRRGWAVDLRRGSKCPDCQKSEAAMRRKLEEKKRMEKQIVAAGKPSPTPAASTNIADFYLLMEDAYDKAARRYKSGWSDERIATETGLALGHVARRRAEDYGPNPPPEPDHIAEITRLAGPVVTEMGHMREALEAMSKHMAALIAEIDAIRGHAAARSREG